MNAPRRIGLALLGLGFAGCARKAEAPPPTPAPPPPSVALVPKAEQSPQFARVNRELEIGGTLYFYADVDGDSLKIAHLAQSWLAGAGKSVPMLRQASKQNFEEIFAALGLNDITAIGVSSVRETNGLFRNRAFLATPNGRHGVLAVFGGPPQPFTRARMAPPNADFYAESDVDLAELYSAAKRVTAIVQGQPAADHLDDQIKEIGVRAGISLLELIEGWKGRMVAIGRIDPHEVYILPGQPGIAIPHLSLMVSIEGIGHPMDQWLRRSPFFAGSDLGTRRLYRPRVNLQVRGLDMVFAVDGSTLYFATSEQFLTECLNRTSGLDQNPVFQRELAELGPTGNGLSYVSPVFFDQFALLPDLNRQASASVRNTLSLIAQQMPHSRRPMLLVRQNLPDGILIRGRYERSFKRELILPAVYNPFTLGLLVAMGVQQRQQQAGLPALGEGGYLESRAPVTMPSRTVPSAPPPISAEGNRQPCLMSSVDPVYPLDLRRQRIDGVVIVDFIVSRAGVPFSVRAVMSPDLEMTAAAEAAVRRWRFHPGLRRNEPVATHMLVPVTFELAGAGPSVDLAAVSRFYATAQGQWRPPGRQATSRLIWARVGLGADGNAIVEDAGRAADGAAAERLKGLLERGLAEQAEALLPYLKSVGHFDIAFPRLRAVSPPPAAVP